MLGIRRSGNSPVRNWINEQFPESLQVINAPADVMQQTEQFGDKDLVISFEELPPQFLDQIECDRKVLILRDPFNLFATRIRHYNALSVHKRFIAPVAASLWNFYADAFLAKNSDILCINYNRFIVDVEYRKELSEKLGGTFSDESLDYVDDNGQGSSFDGVDFDGRAKEMPVFSRWEHYAEVPAFVDLFTPEIIEKSDKIFGEGPWTKSFSS
jgi:hypothetical protein